MRIWGLFIGLVVALGTNGAFALPLEEFDINTCWQKAVDLVSATGRETNPAVHGYECMRWLPILDTRPYHCLMLRQEPWIENRDAKHILHGVGNYPQTWHVLVDCRSNRGFRLSGFEDDDIDQFMESLGKDNVSADEATSIARFYLEARHHEEVARVVEDVFEIQQAVGYFLHQTYGPQESLERLNTWMTGLPASVRDAIEAPHVRAQTDRDYWVSVFVVRDLAEAGKNPRIELSEFRLAVNKNGIASTQAQVTLHPNDQDLQKSESEQSRK